MALETILGFTKRGDTLTLEPRVPRGWPGYAIEYRHGDTPYRIAVELTDAAGPDRAEVVVDGRRIAGSTITLVDDGAAHAVLVRVARAPAPPDPGGTTSGIP